MEKMNVIPFSEVEAEEISWLFYPYIAYGKITLLADDKMPSKEVHDLAAKAQFGFSTLKKAKNYLHLKSFRQGNIWYYPQYTTAKEELL